MILSLETLKYFWAYESFFFSQQKTWSILCDFESPFWSSKQTIWIIKITSLKIWIWHSKQNYLSLFIKIKWACKKLFTIFLIWSSHYIPFIFLFFSKSKTTQVALLSHHHKTKKKKIKKVGWWLYRSRVWIAMIIDIQVSSFVISIPKHEPNKI